MNGCASFRARRPRVRSTKTDARVPFERAASVPSLRHRRPSTSRTVVVGCGRASRATNSRPEESLQKISYGYTVCSHDNNHLKKRRIESPNRISHLAIESIIAFPSLSRSMTDFV